MHLVYAGVPTDGIDGIEVVGIDDVGVEGAREFVVKELRRDGFAVAVNGNPDMFCVEDDCRGVVEVDGVCAAGFIVAGHALAGVIFAEEGLNIAWKVVEVIVIAATAENQQAEEGYDGDDSSFDGAAGHPPQEDGGVGFIGFADHKLKLEKKLFLSFQQIMARVGSTPMGRSYQK